MSSKLSRFIQWVLEKDTKYDSARSLKAHQTKSAEDHKGGGDYLKGIVYGALDGVVTSFAVVAGIIGSNLAANIIVVLGFGKLIGDALSMGLGDYISSKSEFEYALSERDREAWECDNYLEGEKAEMIEIYQDRGMSLEDATELIEIFSKYKHRFVDVMMIEELGMIPPDEDESIAKPAAVTFGSFIIFGLIPLIPFVIGAILKAKITGPDNLYFILCCLTTILTLFALGAWTSRFSNTRWFIAGIQMAFLGAAAAAIAYGVGALGGYILEKAEKGRKPPVAPPFEEPTFFVPQVPTVNRII